jgi:hypothetical protein
MRLPSRGNITDRTSYSWNTRQGRDIPRGDIQLAVIMMRAGFGAVIPLRRDAACGCAAFRDSSIRRSFAAAATAA